MAGLLAAGPRTDRVAPPSMSIPAPPNPVTLSYVGVCAGLAGVVMHALYACLPLSWRRGKTTVTLLSLPVGGIYGLVIWVDALLGGLHTSARVVPVHADVLSLTVGSGGLLGVVGAMAGLSVRYLGRRDIDPQDWTERIAGFGILLGFLLAILVRGLH